MIKNELSEPPAIIYTVLYLGKNNVIKHVKRIDVKKALSILEKLNRTKGENFLRGQFEILTKERLLDKGLSLSKLKKECEMKFKDMKDANDLMKFMEEYISNNPSLSLRLNSLGKKILLSKKELFDKSRFIAYGALGEIGFTTRIPLIGRFGQPLPGLSIVLGTHTLLPGIGADISLLNLGVFLGDFSSSISGEEYSGIGLGGLTLGFIGWMTFLIFPGIYTYIWAAGYYGLNIWFGIFFSKS
jgi:hypothetical protein